MSKCFCILPFIHQEIQQDGHVYTCCRTQSHQSLGNLKEETWQELWNSEQQKKLRMDILSGVWPKECSECMHDEAANIISSRMHMNNKFKHLLSEAKQVQTDGTMPLTTFKYIGIRHSNLCNFTCVYCDHNYSTAWGFDKVTSKIKEPFPQGNEELIQYILHHIDTLEEIYFAGGEPLIDPRHLDLLERLITKGKTQFKLVYNSNLSSLKISGKALIPLWKKFKNVHISASIDDFGERLEFIRNGANWKRIEKNLRILKKENISLDITVTVTNLNILSLTQFIEKLHKELEIPFNSFVLNILRGPTHYSIHNLVLEKKAQAAQKISIFLKKLLIIKQSNEEIRALYYQLKSIYEILKSDKKDVKNYIEEILQDENDKRRTLFYQYWND